MVRSVNLPPSRLQTRTTAPVRLAMVIAACFAISWVSFRALARAPPSFSTRQSPSAASRFTSMIIAIHTLYVCVAAKSSAPLTKRGLSTAAPAPRQTR